MPEYVFDGYCWYRLLAVDGDWLTIDVPGSGPRRVAKRHYLPQSPSGFPGRW